MTDVPALLGGDPIRPGGPPSWPIPDEDVRAALEKAYSQGACGQYRGPNVPLLEEMLAAFHHVPHALTCASGTLAVEAALHALKVGTGDEVIQAAYDYEANFLDIHAVGALPVLVDVDPVNCNMDVDRVEAAITSNTKAILASHLHGGLVAMSRLRAIADRRCIPIVEDSAQATGAIVERRKAGNWGDVGILSFGGSKLVCAGRGGALLIQKPEVLQRAKVWLSRGIQPWAALSELQAAVLIPQLEKLAERTIHRHQQVERLRQLLCDVPGLALFANELSDSLPAYYKVGFWLDPNAFGISRELFVKALRAEGVAFDEGFRALHIGRGNTRYRAGGALTHATAAHERIVTLHHPVLSLCIEEVENVAQAIIKTYRNVERLRG